MKDYIVKILIFIAFFLFLLGILYLLRQSGSTGRAYTHNEYEITLECEKLAAIRTNKDWLYKNCVENLTGSQKEKTKDLKVI